MQEMAADAEFLTVHEAAQRLRVSDSTIWRWISKGKLRAIRLAGRTIRIDARDLEAVARPTSDADVRRDYYVNGVRVLWSYKTGRDTPPDVAIAHAKELHARILARRGGVPLPDSVEDIRLMREERSAQIDQLLDGGR